MCVHMRVRVRVRVRVHVRERVRVRVQVCVHVHVQVQVQGDIIPSERSSHVFLRGKRDDCKGEGVLCDQELRVEPKKTCHSGNDRH